MIKNFLINISVFYKIIFLFLFAIFSFFAFAFYFIEDQKAKEAITSELKYRRFAATINQIIIRNGSMEDIYQYLNELGFEETKDEKIKDTLIQTNRIPSEFEGFVAKTAKIKDEIYILIETPQGATLYKNKHSGYIGNFYIITFVWIGLLALVFVLLIGAFRPLKTLRDNIRRFANGDLDINCELQQKDEIGELANEFNNAVKTIKGLNESRSLFLRSIMHELNTPITKGRIITEMLQDGQQKDRLCSVFKRLGFLIEEFAKLEQMTSRTKKIVKKEFLTQDLIVEIKKMLLIEDQAKDPISVKTSNDLIKADFDLFALAIKNLVDNAIKYSNDGLVQIRTKKDCFIVSNKGEMLEMDFQEYFKPYFKNYENKKSQGFGLGFYIIKNILEAQGFGIDYNYENGYNHFIINGCVVQNFCVINQENKEDDETKKD